MVWGAGRRSGAAEGGLIVDCMKRRSLEPTGDKWEGQVRKRAMNLN